MNRPGFSKGSGDEFAKAVAEAVAGDVFAEAAAVETPPAGPAADAVKGEAAPKFVVPEKWAELAVKLPFLVLAKQHHPAWALTDDEVADATPAMLRVLQQVADKYAPQLLARWAAEHSPVLDLLAVMGVLVWNKWRQVEAAVMPDSESQPASDRVAPPTGRRVVPTIPTFGQMVTEDAS